MQNRGAVRARSPELAATDVYNGQIWVGSISQLGRNQYEAAPASGGSLGIFSSSQAAMQALLEWPPK